MAPDSAVLAKHFSHFLPPFFSLVIFFRKCQSIGKVRIKLIMLKFCRRTLYHVHVISKFGQWFQELEQFFYPCKTGNREQQQTQLAVFHMWEAGKELSSVMPFEVTLIVSMVKNCLVTACCGCLRANSRQH